MTATSAADSVELVLSSREGMERVAMACAAAFAKLAGLPAARIEDLKTAVAESASNAVAHGNRDRQNARVRVSFRLRYGAVEAAVTDEGDGIDREVPEFDIEQIVEGKQAPGGIGLFLMRRLADILSFERLEGGGHTVRIIVKGC